MAPLMERLAAIRATAERLAQEKATKTAKCVAQRTRSGNVKYYAKLTREREVIAQTGGSPYDRVVKRIERLTGVPASQWEHDSRHPYTMRAVEAAQYLAGIDATRTVMGRAA